MRLIRAELCKLNRPLMWGVVLASALFSVLLAVGGAQNARVGAGAAHAPVPSCAQLRVPVGPECATAQQLVRSRAVQAAADRMTAATHTAAQLAPAAAGAEAAGLMASLPGALAIALLAGGHVGGEWSGRTVKNLLTQQGHRYRVLFAKAVSLWAAGAVLVAAAWAALALFGPLLVHLDHLPDPHQSTTAALRWSAEQCGRGLAVLAVFSAIGVLTAVLTRNAIGTMGAASGAFIAMLIAAGLPGLGRWTPATWVQQWMGFAAGQRSITDLPDNFWSRFFDTAGAPLGQWSASAALAALAAACLAAAIAVFRRSDITG